MSTEDKLKEMKKYIGSIPFPSDLVQNRSSTKQRVYIVLKIEWEWQDIVQVCATEEIAIRERDKLRSKISLDEPHYQELVDCIQYQAFDVMMEK